MNDVIILELAADAETVLQAGQCAADGSWCPVTDMAGRVAVIVLQGSLVASHTVALPRLSDTKLLKILPGVMDDKLSRAGVSRHFALLDIPGDRAERLVGVIDREVMDKVLHTAARLGVAVRALVPDFMLLPRPEAGVNACMRDDMVHARRLDGTGFSAEKALADVMLAGLKPEKISAEAWQLLLTQAADNDANLLQGGYAPRGDMVQMLRLLRRAGGLAAAALVLWFGTILYGAYDNQRQADAYDRAAEQLFRATLPDVLRIVNMGAQMRQALDAYRGRGSSEFFGLSDTVFRAIQDHNQVTLEGLRFDQTTGELALNVSFASFAEGDAFRQQMAGAGALVTEGGSRQENGRVFSEMTIRRAH